MLTIVMFERSRRICASAMKARGGTLWLRQPEESAGCVMQELVFFVSKMNSCCIFGSLPPRPEMYQAAVIAEDGQGRGRPLPLDFLSVVVRLDGRRRG